MLESVSAGGGPDEESECQCELASNIPRLMFN